MLESRNLSPLLRWAGGKRWLASAIRAASDVADAGTYIEPFVGGAAAFLATRWPEAIIGDTNDALVACYRGLAGDVERVRNELEALTMSAAEFERQKTVATCSDVDAAVRLIFLNRAAYGGIYRVNRFGQFNVPYSGDRQLGPILRGTRLEDVSEALASATIVAADFQSLVSRAGLGSLVYCDPPYSLPGGESTFRRYGSAPFNWEGQVRLAEAVAAAGLRGAAAVISNSADPMVAELYPEADVIEVERPHAWTRKRTPEAVFVLHPNRDTQARMAAQIRSMILTATVP